MKIKSWRLKIREEEIDEFKEIVEKPVNANIIKLMLKLEVLGKRYSGIEIDRAIGELENTGIIEDLEPDRRIGIVTWLCGKFLLTAAALDGLEKISEIDK